MLLFFHPLILNFDNCPPLNSCSCFQQALLPCQQILSIDKDRLFHSLINVISSMIMSVDSQNITLAVLVETCEGLTAYFVFV